MFNFFLYNTLLYMSFPTKQAKKEYDNNYLNYLMLQIKNADKIVERNKGVDLSMPPVVEDDTRPLEDQLLDQTKQKKQAQLNAQKLFDKDTSRIDKLISYLYENDLFTDFNQKYPTLYKELKTKNAFVTVQQVINMLEKLIELPDEANNNNGVSDTLLNSLTNALNTFGGVDEDTNEENQNNNGFVNSLNDTINTFGGVDDYDDDADSSWRNIFFGQGIKKKKTKMTKKEKELHKKLKELLKK